MAYYLGQLGKIIQWFKTDHSLDGHINIINTQYCTTCAGWPHHRGVPQPREPRPQPHTQPLQLPTAPGEYSTVQHSTVIVQYRSTVHGTAEHTSPHEKMSQILRGICLSDKSKCCSATWQFESSNLEPWAVGAGARFIGFKHDFKTLLEVWDFL